LSPAWWCTPVIPVLERLKQEDGKFKISLGYIVRLCYQKRRKEKEKRNLLGFVTKDVNQDDTFDVFSFFFSI
jgi:hypothetical protein